MPQCSPAAWSGSYIDAYRRNRQPTPNELMAELKDTAWTCASHQRRRLCQLPAELYVATHHGQPRAEVPDEPRHPRRTAPAPAPHLSARTKTAARIEEVLDHPLLTCSPGEPGP